MRADGGMLTRGWFVTSSLGALTAPAFAADPALTPVRVGATPNTDIVSVLWGVQSGLFAKDGLDVSIVRLNSGAATAAAVIGHSIDIGRSSTFGLIEAHTKGVPFELVSMSAIYDAAAPNTAFAVAKDSPIASARELDGRTIATPSLNDYFTLVTSAWIDQNGGDSKTLRFVELPIPLAAAAIKDGRVSGGILVDPYLIEATATDGGCRILGYPDKAIAPKFGVTYFFCLSSYARRSADVIARFQRAHAAATQYASSHPAEMIPLIVTYTNLSEQDVAQTPSISAPGSIRTCFSR
jgi:NitT/TauT family transport system substrate-binding protein